MIERYGGRRAVDDLISRRTPDKNNDFGAFDIVLDGISSGDAAWLALVPKLDTGGHAAVGESLPIAVAYALPKNATGVQRKLRLHDAGRMVQTTWDSSPAPQPCSVSTSK